MTLNNPDVRQDLLRERLACGESLAVTDLCAEFGVSADTVRRDLIALEGLGAARRVRGGAVPLTKPVAALRERKDTQAPPSRGLLQQAGQALEGATTLLLDGGLTVLALARELMATPDLLVVTPSPWVGTATCERGIETVLLGGRVSERGGIAVGAEVERALSGLAADVAVLGACGLDAGFGLSSDDLQENAVSRRMALAAGRVLVLTSADKLGRRARHRTLAPEEIDMIVTDTVPQGSEASDEIRAFRAAGVEVRCG